MGCWSERQFVGVRVRLLERDMGCWSERQFVGVRVRLLE